MGRVSELPGPKHSCLGPRTVGERLVSCAHILNRFKLTHVERPVSADRIREVGDRDFDSASQHLDRIIDFSRRLRPERYLNHSEGFGLCSASFLGIA